MSTLMYELRDALKRLIARPGFSLLSLLVLSGGLGSFLLMLSFVDTFILRPMPFRDAERLVSISYARSSDREDLQFIPSSKVAALRQELAQLDALEAYTEATVNLRDANPPTRYDGGFVTSGLFPLLGTAPFLGRGFSAADDRPGAPLTVVLAYETWRDRLGSDPNAIGRAIVANAQPATIIGVMPPGFAFPRHEQVWLPARLDTTARPDEFSYEILGHLKPGATLASVSAEMEAAFARDLKQRPHELEHLVPSVSAVAERYVNHHTRNYIWLMFGAGSFVLLLACANVTNLHLVQTIARQRELAVRVALGAGRARLMLNAFAESLLLGTAATALALWLASLGDRWVMATFAAAGDAPSYWFNPHVDGRMLGYAALAALLTSMVSGGLPAVRAGRIGLQAHLRDGDRGGQGGGFARFARGLVVGEIALSVVLMCSAVVSAATLRGLLTFDLGTRADPNRVMTARVAVFAENYPEGKDQTAFFARVAARLRSEPGVAAATAASILPGDLADGTSVRTEGDSSAAPTTPTYFGSVDTEFARTYGIDVVAGRWFGADDTADSDPVVIVDQRFVEQVLGGREALGRRILTDPDNPASKWRRIVGVTRPVHISGVESKRRPLVLAPMAQQPVRFASIAVRIDGDAAAFAPRIAAAVRAEDADTPVYWVRTQQQAIENRRVGSQILAEVFGGFGALGLLLAGAGLYGVLSFSVAQRTREIGLRRAVGATNRDVLGAVAGRSARQVAIGLTAGLILGVPWGLLLGSQSPDGNSAGVAGFLLVVGTIVLAACCATWLPTRRALAVDPMVALRYE